MKKRERSGILGGALIGAVNGLFGGGGGMIAVPLLSRLGYGRKEAHATAILIIAPVCAVSVISYIINGFINLPVIIPSAIGNIAGGLLGAKLLDKIPAVWVEVAFIAIMLAAGLKMVF